MSFSVGLEKAPLSQKDRIQILRDRKEVDQIIADEQQKLAIVEHLKNQAQASLDRVRVLKEQREKLDRDQHTELKRLDTEINLDLNESILIKEKLSLAELDLARAVLNRRKVDEKIFKLEEQEEIISDWQERRKDMRHAIEKANNQRREKTLESTVKNLEQERQAENEIMNSKMIQQKQASKNASKYLKASVKKLKENDKKNDEIISELTQKRLNAVLDLKNSIERSKKNEGLPKKLKLKPKETLDSIKERLQEEFKNEQVDTNPSEPIYSLLDETTRLEEQIRTQKIKAALGDQISSDSEIEDVAIPDEDDFEEQRNLLALTDKSVSDVKSPQTEIPTWMNKKDKSTISDKSKKQRTKNQIALKNVTDNAIKKHRANLLKPKTQTVCHRHFSGPAFACSSSEIKFNDTVPYKEFSKTLQMTNVSYAMNSLKLLDVTGNIKDFLKVKLEKSSGQISAGMSLNLTVVLKTRQAKNFHGEINFLCSTGQFSIPVFSFLPCFSPVFTEKEFNFKNVILGQTLTKKISIKNEGKLQGSVTIKPKQLIENCFEIIEPTFDTVNLQPDQSQDIEVRFVGNRPGDFSGEIEVLLQSVDKIF